MTTPLIEAIARAMPGQACWHLRLIDAHGIATAITQAGYAVVPVEPTEAMVEIAPHHDRDDMASYREIYLAMIAAAQAPHIMPPPMRDAGPLESEEGE